MSSRGDRTPAKEQAIGLREGKDNHTTRGMTKDEKKNSITHSSFSDSASECMWKTDDTKTDDTNVQQQEESVKPEDENTEPEDEQLAEGEESDETEPEMTAEDIAALDVAWEAVGIEGDWEPFTMEKKSH